MDFNIHIDTISMEMPSMEMPIVYFFKGVQDITLPIMKYFWPWRLRLHYIQCRPWQNNALCGISSGSLLFVKVPVSEFPVYKR